MPLGIDSPRGSMPTPASPAPSAPASDEATCCSAPALAENITLGTRRCLHCGAHWQQQEDGHWLSQPAAASDSSAAE